MKPISRNRTVSGTSLVEILVVIVVFLVGILAVVQVFPGGFRLLNITRNNTVASELARAQIEQLKARSDQLPDAIVPVRYVFSGGTVSIIAEPNRYTSDLGPSVADLRQDGNFYDGGGNLIGYWPYLVGANVSRRVLGEGKAIPTPKQIGSQYGSLLILQFAPVVYNPTGYYNSLFVVYGNDMSRRDGDPVGAGIGVRPYEYFVDAEDTGDAMLYLPTLTGKSISYRINLTAYVSSGGNVVRRDIVDIIEPVAAGAGPELVRVDSLPGVVGAGESLVGVDYDSIHIARAFDDVTATGFTNDPYEYKLLSAELGSVLFNPAGYNFYVRRPGGQREPLRGRVSYDVYDWRIIREEFRAGDVAPVQFKLALGSLMVSGQAGADNRAYSGMGVRIPDRNNNPQTVDLILQDMDTGGIYVYDPSNPGDPSPSPSTFNDINIDPTRSSYFVNKSTGVIKLVDYDRDPSNGTQMMLMLPGNASPVVVTADNRNMRALYQARGEWAVQVLKPSARYSRSFNANPGIGSYWLGNNGRVYFPRADAGRSVSLGEIYYILRDAGGQLTAFGPESITATILATPADPNGPYIDVAALLPYDRNSFSWNSWDESYGSAVKNVKGASVAVRVLWNPDTFTLGTNSVANVDGLEKWMQGWRRSTVETFLQRAN